MHDPTFIHVINDISEDALFGSFEVPTKYNTDLLLNALERELRARFPGVEVSVEGGQHTKIDTDGDDIEHIVMDIVGQTWQDWLETLG